MRFRPLAIVLVVVAIDYAIWSSSSAGGSDVAATLSGLTLPPLIAALLVLTAVNVMRALGGATRRRPATYAVQQRTPRRKLATRRTSVGVPAGAAAPAIMGSDTEDPAVAASSRASSPKIAA